MKKYLWTSIIASVLLIIGAFLLGRFVMPNLAPGNLPLPELSDGQRGELGIDKNINESTIDKYLGRSDAVYRDLRMLDDPGNYEAIGGDSRLSGIVKGFEVVPLPYIVNVTGLPEAVGDTYTGKTLFTDNGDGTYTANYKESMTMLEDLFPKDKIIFLMCGGGGYSGMMKKMLVALGWDGNKIYNTGGYWFYEGDNKIEIKRVLDDGSVEYDYYKVPYHEINFEDLHELAPGEMISLTIEEYDKMIAEGRSFLLFVDQGGCTTADRLREFVRNYARKHSLVVYTMMFSKVRETSLHDYVKYYPSVVWIKHGNPEKWLRADEDEDSDEYNNEAVFDEWMDGGGALINK